MCLQCESEWRPEMVTTSRRQRSSTINLSQAWNRHEAAEEDDDPDLPPSGEYENDLGDDEEEEEDTPEEDEEEESVTEDEEFHLCNGTCTFCDDNQACCVELVSVESLLAGNLSHCWTPWATTLASCTRQGPHICSYCLADRGWEGCNHLCAWCQNGVEYLTTGRPRTARRCCLREGHPGDSWPYHFCNVCRWLPGHMIDAINDHSIGNDNNNGGEDPGDDAGRPGSSGEPQDGVQNNQPQPVQTQSHGYRERSRSRSPNLMFGNLRGGAVDDLPQGEVAPAKELEAEECFEKAFQCPQYGSTAGLQLQLGFLCIDCHNRQEDRWFEEHGDDDGAQCLPSWSIEPTETFEPDTVAQLAPQPLRVLIESSEEDDPLTPTEPWSAEKRWKRPDDLQKDDEDEDYNQAIYDSIESQNAWVQRNQVVPLEEYAKR